MQPPKPPPVFDCGMGCRFRTEFQGCALACRENEHLAVNVQIDRWLRNLGRHTVEHTWHLANSHLWGVAGLPPDHQSVNLRKRAEVDHGLCIVAVDFGEGVRLKRYSRPFAL